MVTDCWHFPAQNQKRKPNDLTPNDSRKKFRYHQRLMQMFWRQWRNEYLTSLREHHWTRRASYNQKIKVGDVVLMHDDTSRNQWRLVSIIKIHRAKDDLIRAQGRLPFERKIRLEWNARNGTGFSRCGVSPSPRLSRLEENNNKSK